MRPVHRVGSRMLVLAVTLSLLIGAYVRRSGFDVQSLIQSRPIKIRMRRTCEVCPNYVITVSDDGLITYEGQDATLVQGVHSFYIDRSIVNRLIDHFVQSEFAELDNTYPAPGRHRMTLSLSIEMNGLSKNILSEDRYGPTILQTLEGEIDDLPGMRALSGWTH